MDLQNKMEKNCKSWTDDESQVLFFVNKTEQAFVQISWMSSINVKFKTVLLVFHKFYGFCLKYFSKFPHPQSENIFIFFLLLFCTWQQKQMKLQQKLATEIKAREFNIAEKISFNITLIVVVLKQKPQN